MSYKNNFIAGITELLVLAILDQRDSYVYEITKNIAGDSEGLLSISLNTIYTVAYKLEEENMISEYPKLVGKKRTRVYYHLEPRGKEHLERISADYSKMTEGVKKVLNSLGGNTND